jgi:hypothetical protein
MKNRLRQIGFITVATIIELAFTACDDGNETTGGNTGSGSCTRSNIKGVL